MVTISTGFFLTLLVMAVLFVIWLAWRVTHPMECKCGFSSRLVWRFKKHVLTGHGWK